MDVSGGVRLQMASAERTTISVQGAIEAPADISGFFGLPSPIKPHRIGGRIHIPDQVSE
jgi:hypothetical protein